MQHWTGGERNIEALKSPVWTDGKAAVLVIQGLWGHAVLFPLALTPRSQYYKMTRFVSYSPLLPYSSL